jgi:hypothetical protein
MAEQAEKFRREINAIATEDTKETKVTLHQQKIPFLLSYLS